MKKLAIIGGGSWGTALSIVLAPRAARVSLWMRDSALAARVQASRTNDPYLPELRLPDNVAATADVADALDGADTVLSVMPSHACREIYSKMVPWIGPHLRLVSATKGLESNTLLRMSEVIRETAGGRSSRPVAALSGPTFAREIAGGGPAAVVIACDDAALAEEVQQDFSGPSFRLYTNADVAGVEFGGALKNVIAIGAGVCQGLGLGTNAAAALITRGLAEITRLACAFGARRETLAGLAGLGDLVLTATGSLSRNRALGIELARGRSLADVTASTRMVAEGVKTTAAAFELSRRSGMGMPIVEQMHAMLFDGRPPREAIRLLMDRPLKKEL